MKDRKRKYDYSSVFQCFKLYEYVYECAKEELDANTKLVSNRAERLVIDYPDDFIKKYFPSSYSLSYDEEVREMLYDGVLRNSRYSPLSFCIWTDDNRGEAGKDTIHIIKPDHFSERIIDIDALLKIVEKKKKIDEIEKSLKSCKEEYE